MNLSEEIVSTILLVQSVLIIVLLVFVVLLWKKMNRFLVGKDSLNLEDSLRHTKQSLDAHKKFEGEMSTYLTSVEKRLRKSVQHVETVRFNPFKGSGSGGNQSFATALLNESGDGVVLSSLYARDRITIFSKPVSKFSSSVELTSEEKGVIEKAKKS
ncbi:hypothetical protein COB55_01830 [Candidatus Wolfebacteria bacterium]|nr:MAG: hypothetical protein COB55_01830 [Candidatus Wolfebacteria bacterium]